MRKIRLFERIGIISLCIMLVITLGMAGNIDMDLQIPNYMHITYIINLSICLFSLYYAYILKERRRNDIRIKLRSKQVASINDNSKIIKVNFN